MENLALFPRIEPETKNGTIEIYKIRRAKIIKHIRVFHRHCQKNVLQVFFKGSKEYFSVMCSHSPSFSDVATIAQMIYTQ